MAEGDGAGKAFQPLVPPPAPDPITRQRRGLEMVTAANRLALGWMNAAAAQHAAMTRRALRQMTETARRSAAAETPSEQAAAMLAALDSAREMGLATVRGINELMLRMQGDAARLVERAMAGKPGPEDRHCSPDEHKL